MRSADTSIGAAAARGMTWSVVQNWGGKLLTFVLFVILARILTPTDFGVVSAAWIVLAFIAQVAEFGFGDAVVQRPGLVASDINLPFVVSLSVSIGLTLAVVCLSSSIESWLGIKNLTPVLTALALTAPLMTASAFQEMNYKRQQDFRKLAVRTITANLISGPFALAAAWLGAGVWSLVIQTYIATLIGLVWLWYHSHWWPSVKFNVTSFLELTKYSIYVVSLRIMDFAVVRLVDIIIIGRFGVAVFGLYSVGSRIYQTLMMLLQTALNDVTLSVLSRISNDRERMAKIYLQTISLASSVAAPVFVLSAAVAPEMCSILFGKKWAGVELIAEPLLLLGALQCVQFMNSSYLGSRGKPNLTLVAAIAKYAAIVVGLLLVPAKDAATVVQAYTLLQLVATPISFGAVMHELHLKVSELARRVAVPATACICAIAMVHILRPLLARLSTSAPVALLVFSAMFALCYTAVFLLIGRGLAIELKTIVETKLRARKSFVPGDAS